MLSKKSKAEGGNVDRGEEPRTGRETTFASRIDQVLRQLFVGRAQEVAAFRAALAPASETSLLFVTGELGVGKSALLTQLAATAADDGVDCHRLDARLVALRAALTDATEVLGDRGWGRRRRVLLIDHFEVCAETSEDDERWFIETYLPSLPTSVLVVIADRRTTLQVDAAGLIPPLCQRLPLRPLTTSEAADCLGRRGLPEEARAGVLTFANGIPLLLVGGAEAALDGRAPTGGLGAGTLSRVKRELGGAADTHERRAVLAALVLARTVVFDLLASLFDQAPNADGLYGWLASRSFVEETPMGLRPHAVARAAGLAMLQQDHPQLFASVLGRLQTFYDWQIRQPLGPHERWVVDRMFLEQHRPLLREHLRFDYDGFKVLRARPEDHEAVVALTAIQDGATAASWIERWLVSGAGACDVLRGPAGELGGFMLSAPMPPRWPDDIARDPALLAIDAFLDEQGWTPSATESVIVIRAALVDGGGGHGQAISMLLTTHTSTTLMRVPGLQLLFGISRTPELWRAAGDAMSFVHRVVSTYEDGSYRHSVLAHDRRALGPRRVDAEPTLASVDVGAPARSTIRPPPKHDANGGLAFGALLREQLARLAEAAGLTTREKEVLDLLVLGRNATEIGKVLDISARTAKFHQARLLSKLGADSRVDLIRLLL